MGTRKGCWHFPQRTFRPLIFSGTERIALHCGFGHRCLNDRMMRLQQTSAPLRWLYRRGAAEG